MIFNHEITQTYDDWLQTPTGRYIDGREKSLILDLTAPRGGEKVLDIGCGTGEHLILFMKKGCQITGVEKSPYMLDMAKQKLGHRGDFYLERAEYLPFPDNEFDIVSIINALEFMDDPQQAISEAIRVCRGRVFMGGMNKLSTAGRIWKYKCTRYSSVYHHAKFFHMGQLTRMVRIHLQGVRIRWGSVVFLPYQWYTFATGMEEKIPVMKNPFGAFWGLSFPVTFTYRTIQDIIREPFEIKHRRRQPATGIVREIRK